MRANYNDLKNGIHETTDYLELFLRNLLLDENNELHNREMHISGKFNLSKKADIKDAKADIRKRLEDTQPNVSEKTINHILALFERYDKKQIFGRSSVETVTGLKSTRSSELITLLLEKQIIEPVKGHGKGKYHFI